MRTLGITGLLVAAAALLALSGCGSGSNGVQDAATLPIRAVGEGVRTLEKGVSGVTELGGGLVGKILTDRNRASLLREHRELREHLDAVEAYIRNREILLPAQDRLILRNDRDTLAAVERQLEAKRIPANTGMSIYRRLDGVRASFDLFQQQHNTPPYRGFVADR